MLKQIIFIHSAKDGFTLPGIMDDPACTAGIPSSANPAIGPDAISLMSFASFPISSAKLRKDIENSPVIVTLLTPKIGYLKSAELFKESLKTGKTIRELVVSKKLLSNKEIDSLFG